MDPFHAVILDHKQVQIKGVRRKEEDTKRLYAELPVDLFPVPTSRFIRVDDLVTQPACRLLLKIGNNFINSFRHLDYGVGH